MLVEFCVVLYPLINMHTHCHTHTHTHTHTGANPRAGHGARAPVEGRAGSWEAGGACEDPPVPADRCPAAT